jgi:TonB family protein
MKDRLVIVIAGFILFVSFPSAAQNPPLPAECMGGEPVEPKPPAYPPALAGKQVSGKVTLVVAHDDCGRATDVVVERSSGEAELDAAAIEAAHSWRFSPYDQEGKRTAGKVRIPIDFNTDDNFSHVNPKDGGFDQLLEQWERMQVDEVQADADGTVPGYLPDPQLIAMASVQEVIAMLEAKGERVGNAAPDVSTYRLKDDLDITSWDVFSGGWRFAPSAVRMRLVTDGKKSFWVTRGICGASDPGACELFDQYLRDKQRQMTSPPPPPPPPRALEAN